MRFRTTLTTALLALAVLTTRAGADSVEPTASRSSAAVTRAGAQAPTPRPKAATSLFLAPVTAYLGSSAVLAPRVTFSGGPSDDRRWAVPTCRFELQFPSLPTRTYDKPCNAPFSIDVPDDRSYHDSAATARVLASADLLASAWASTHVSFRKGPTLLEINYGHGQLPSNLAPVAGVTKAEDVIVTLYKTLPDGSNRAPLPNRPLVVTVTGGQATAVPTSDAQGNVSFQVLHVNGATPAVDVLFQGDGSYAPSSATAELRPGPPPPHGHVH